MTARHFVRDGEADSMTSTGLNPQHLRPARVTSERLTAVESANDRVEFLLAQLLMAEEAAREELITSVKRAEREQMAQIVLDPVPEPDLEPEDAMSWIEDRQPEKPTGPDESAQPEALDEPELSGEPEPLDELAQPAPLGEPEPLDEHTSLDEPAEPESLDEPSFVEELDESAQPDESVSPRGNEEPIDPHDVTTPDSSPDGRVAVQRIRVSGIPEVIAVEEPPEETRDRFLRPEVKPGSKLATPDGERLAAKDRSERLDVGMSVMDDDASGRTRELVRRTHEPRQEGFFGTVGAFVARVLHLD